MSGGSKVSTTTAEPWVEQQDYLEAGFKQAADVYGKGPADYYSGTTLAGFTPSETAAQKGIAGYVTGPRAAGQQSYAEGASTRGLSGEIDLTKFNPMMASLGSQMKSQLEGKILPGIRQSLVEYQPGGSSRGDIVQSQAIAGANQQMLNKAAEMYGGAYQGAQDRAVQWGGLYPSIMNAPLATYGALGEVGAGQREMQQEAINRDMAKYQYDATAPQQQLANYMSMISGDYGGTTTQTTPGPSGLQTLGQIASMASMFKGSDERFKENIKQVGVHKGFNIYEYNYLWSPKKWIGVIAQEVEKIMPEAVIKVNGYRFVNYGMIV
jgi:hypothetical protein|tara:strand:- start:1407 stop:2375 length:969 start_codon:yes stop_codon:yes gene_type:complete